MQRLEDTVAPWKVADDTICSWSTRCAMSHFREPRIPAQSSYCQNPFSMLRNAVIGCAYLSEMYAVASVDKRIKQIGYPAPALSGKKAFNILEYKSFRAMLCNQPGKDCNQRITSIPWLAQAR